MPRKPKVERNEALVLLKDKHGKSWMWLAKAFEVSKPSLIEAYKRAKKVDSRGRVIHTHN